MNYIARILVLAIFAGFLIFAGCRQRPTPSQTKLAVYPEQKSQEPNIQILALETSSPIELIVAGAYDLKVEEIDGRKRPGGSSTPVSLKVQVVAEGIKVGKNTYKWTEVKPRGKFRLRIRYTDAKGIKIENSFPGALSFSRSLTGSLRVVVDLPLEQYLVGVLPSEMPLSFPPEALKAQAVAARTYALYQIKTREGKAYDVFSDVRSQMWKPSLQADPRAKMAVNATSGLVLTESFRLFPTYFHSDCGGYTAQAKNVFSSSDMTALSGVECPYVAESYRWKFSISKEDLSARLRRAGIGNGRVRRIRILDANQRELSALGRVYYVEVVTDNGVKRIVPANKFRLAVGAGKSQLASTYLEAVHSDNAIVFKGRGFGHGVGLCQNGAKYWAKDGSDFVKILHFYYPGSKIVKVW